MKKRIIVLCSKCECDVLECQCPDRPEEQNLYWFYVHRWSEEFLRALRSLGIIK
jgi:hypothetical protein